MDDSSRPGWTNPADRPASRTQTQLIERAAPLFWNELQEQLGAAVVDEVTGAAQADIVALCVFTDEQVREVCLDGALLSSMPSGSTLVVHTTTSPKTIASRLKSKAG